MLHREDRHHKFHRPHNGVPRFIFSRSMNIGIEVNDGAQSQGAECSFKKPRGSLESEMVNL